MGIGRPVSSLCGSMPMMCRCRRRRRKFGAHAFHASGTAYAPRGLDALGYGGKRERKSVSFPLYTSFKLTGDTLGSEAENACISALPKDSTSTLGNSERKSCSLTMPFFSSSERLLRYESRSVSGVSVSIKRWRVYRVGIWPGMESHVSLLCCSVCNRRKRLAKAWTESMASVHHRALFVHSHAWCET